MRERIPIIIVIFILFYFSCKKDNEVDTPSVSIILPVGTPTYTVNDTIIIKATVGDQVSLQTVTVYVANSQNEPVFPSVSVPVTGKNMTFSCSYPLNNIHATSGQYNIVVKASNGTNTGYAFKQININAIPTVLTGIYTITRDKTGVHVVKVDTNYNVSTVYTQGGDYSSSDISTYYQQLYLTAADSGNVTALSLPIVSTAWSYAGIISPTPCFTGTYSYGNAVYVTQYNGLIKYFNNKGIGELNTTVATGNYPVKTIVWGNYLFVEQKNIGSQACNLVLDYAANGFNFQQSNLPGPLVTMFGMDANDIFVFGNNNSGGAYMEQYNIPGNLYFSPITMPSGNLLSAAQVDSMTYLLGFSTGTIYLYTYNPNSIVPYLNGVIATHMQYDVTRNSLYISSGKYVYDYNYATAGLLHTCNIQDSILNMHLLYNK